MDLKINKRELHRWSNYSDGDDGDLAKHQKFLTALQKQKHLKGVVERLNDRIERLEKERKEIIELIDQFNGLNNRILKLKYVEGLTLESVAEKTGYTYQYIRSRHADIMKMIRFSKNV
ncbi:sigma-70 family RNA polymerase sigma factor [Enterococcus sp. AZ095b]|uniref:sigma-70 family RNA polymerase sigma factor n=1 Tax=Enterococcus sp. AZ095b TaxID=2774791 RepID=UPI003F686531